MNRDPTSKSLHSNSYRFRLVSMSCDPNFTFSIDNHTMTIIEADSQSTEPLVVDSIQIFAGTFHKKEFLQNNLQITQKGQRYSFVVSLIS